MVSRFLFIRSVLFHCALLIHLLHLRSCSLCCVFFSRTLAGFCSLAHSFTSFSFGYVSNSDFFPLFPILRLPFVGLPRLSLSLSLSLLFPIFPLPLPSPFPLPLPPPEGYQRAFSPAYLAAAPRRGRVSCSRRPSVCVVLRRKCVRTGGEGEVVGGEGLKGTKKRKLPCRGRYFHAATCTRTHSAGRRTQSSRNIMCHLTRTRKYTHAYSTRHTRAHIAG